MSMTFEWLSPSSRMRRMGSLVPVVCAELAASDSAKARLSENNLFIVVGLTGPIRPIGRIVFALWFVKLFLFLPPGHPVLVPFPFPVLLLPHPLPAPNGRPPRRLQRQWDQDPPECFAQIPGHRPRARCDKYPGLPEERRRNQSVDAPRNHHRRRQLRRRLRHRFRLLSRPRGHPALVSARPLLHPPGAAFEPENWLFGRWCEDPKSHGEGPPLFWLAVHEPCFRKYPRFSCSLFRLWRAENSREARQIADFGRRNGDWCAHALAHYANGWRRKVGRAAGCRRGIRI